MKKIFLPMLLGVLFIACNNSSTVTTAATDPAAEAYAKNLATAKELFAAFASKDSVKMASFTSDDFKWSPPAVGMDSLSKSQWLDVMKNFMHTYNDITFTNTQYHKGVDSTEKFDGSVRVYGLWNSKFAKNGKTGLLKYYASMDFNKEGKMVSIMEYYNPADLSIER